MKTVRKNCRSGAGAALIIVLAFIVLLTGVMVIFFTQALSYRTQGNSSFNDFKSAALAQSGLETVVGDLEQEITNGSTAYGYTNASGVTNSYVYIPTTNLYAVPQRSGNPPVVGGIDPIPNLVRISVRTETYPTGLGVSSRASADSTTNAAATGQYISLPRWNKHYLIPRTLAGSTTIDTTPISAFSAPDWVYVTSVGPTNINTAVITAGTPKVIGRYAYAIYDEGGLLDANVAGFPSDTATNSTHPASPNVYNMAAWGSGLKGSEAFADLTSLPYPFTQPQIDQLVGWRNNATAQPAGSYNSYTFTSTSAVNYHDAMVNATNGFLLTSGNSRIDPTVATQIDTDQVFPSRQSLITFINDSGMPQDALQYLGTFTRALEQPAYNPPVGRPLVQSSGFANTTPFGTGNDASGGDRYSVAPTTNNPTDINPPLLSVRVANSFVRVDGTTAQVGDALIKERFPLSRLSLFPINSATVSTTVAAQIYQYFGLTQNTSTGIWTYNHGNSTGIYRLSQVAALTGTAAREPDFFELLKAAINVGSLGKGSAYDINAGFTYWSDNPSAAYLQQARDYQSQLQILRIGANIIDQSKADDYPTQIAFSGAPTFVVRGVEDLPYLYRIHNWIMRTGTTGSLGAILLQPELWNPHSTGSSTFVASTSMPTSFRVRLGLDTSSSAAPLTTMFATYGDGTVTADLSGTSTLNSGTMPSPLLFNAGAPNYWDFREPTLLAQIGKPAGSYPSNLSTASSNIFTDYPAYAPDPNRKMTGFLVISFPWTDAAGSPDQKFNLEQNGANSALHYYVEYLNPSGNWIAYDEQVAQPYDGITFNTKIVNTSSGYNDINAQNLQSIPANPWGGEGRTDPRTSRWGFFTAGFLNFIPPVTTGPDADTSADPVVWSTYRPDGGISYGDHLGSRTDHAFHYGSSYGNSGYDGFQHGYWAENDVRTTYQTDGTSGTALLRYNLDPDGIPRRAVGGYVTDTLNGGTAVSASQPLTGLPLATSNYSSRPTILHRPFRSVAELGYAFRDTPWGDINFTFPESGDSPLFDVFCVNDTSSTYGLVAGRVNLNSRQAPVLAALLSGTLRDKDDSTAPVLSQTMASDLAHQMVVRTTAATVTSTTQGPLMSRADLVGTWIGPSVPTGASGSSGQLSSAATADTINPDNFYTGFSHDIGTIAVPSVNGTPAVALIPRQRNAVMRALVDSGTTRTWNLLIDLVAQSGRFPPKSTAFSSFVVEGEKHYWLHVAIDRYTGKVIGSQLEVVRE